MNKRNLFTSLCEIVGGVMVTIGVGLIYAPAAIIVGGILLIVIGGLIA